MVNETSSSLSLLGATSLDAAGLNDTVYTRTLELIAVFTVSAIVFLPLLHNAIVFHPTIGMTDYEAHNLIATHMGERDIVPLPHFLYHALALTLTKGIAIKISTASLIIMVLSFAAVPTMIAHILPSIQWRSLILAGCAAIVAPITLVTLPWNKMYFGYIPLAIYHSPTMALMKPLALVHFYFASKSIVAGQRTSFTYVRDIGLLALTTLAKPSYTLCLLPAAIVFAGIERYRGRSISIAYTFFGVVLPAALLLAWQYFFLWVSGSSDEIVKLTSFEFRPFAAVMSVASHGPQWLVACSLFVRFVSSVAFPVLVYFTLRHRLHKFIEYRFAFWLFAFGCASFYLLADSGKNLTNLNFSWGASIALFIWFIASLRVLLSEWSVTLPTRMRTACSVAFILHVVCGAIWYIAQFRTAWFDSW
jgi:hypothetical protein